MLSTGNRNESIRRRIFIDIIVLGAVEAQEFIFSQAGGEGRVTLLPLDGPHIMDQADGLARNVSGVCIPVGSQAHPQVFRLAHVDDPLGLVAHDVNARRRWNRPEELSAQTCQEGLGMLEEAELSFRHEVVVKESRCECKWNGGPSAGA